ncbi:MAG: sorbosone dehydrogenase family protein, partial [Myxococcales bacterium]|nr:sorbosone dehydrogenase family protein [Myxococcales bacterium]
SPSGTLFVGTRPQGKVYAIPNTDGDNRGDRVITIAKGLNIPNGVVFHEGDLYVAELSRILRYPDIEKHLDSPPKPEVVTHNYPKDPHHGWKFIAKGPDGKLYVPVGAPCNVCESKNPLFATITRIGFDGKNREIVAHGVRNTVGFDWHPTTKELWFTDNGRDWLGDDAPPDELNRLEKEGSHFGFPYCHAGHITDPDFGKKRPCSSTVPPAQRLGPHVAALGMRFYTGNMFPKAYQNQILIAEHGSWNRSERIGYRVMRVTLDGNRPTSYEVFADGWLDGDDVKGRPVDLLVMPDGAILLSDDHAGAIYRIDYAAP